MRVVQRVYFFKGSARFFFVEWPLTCLSHRRFHWPGFAVIAALPDGKTWTTVCDVSQADALVMMLMISNELRGKLKPVLSFIS